MKVSTIGKASAAFAALGTVAGPYAAVAGAAPIHASAAARPATTAARSLASLPIVGGCAVSDYRRQEVTHLTNTSTGAVGSDTAELWYSPSSRCVYAKFVNVSRTCGVTTAAGFNRCTASLQQTDSSGGNGSEIQHCVISSGQNSCTTGSIYDGGLLAATIGTKLDGQSWYGKTDWW